MNDYKFAFLIFALFLYFDWYVSRSLSGHNYGNIVACILTCTMILLWLSMLNFNFSKFIKKQFKKLLPYRLVLRTHYANEREKELIRIGLEQFQKAIWDNKVPLSYFRKFGPLNDAKQIVRLDDELFSIIQKLK